MTELNRRTVLTGAAVASAATALTPLPSAGQAAAPLLGNAGAGLVPLQGRQLRDHRVTDGRNTFKFPDTFVLNAKKDQVNEALAAAYMEKDMMTIPYTPIVVNTGSKLVVDRHRHRRSQLRAQQGRRRPVPRQPEGRRASTATRSTSSSSRTSTATTSTA